MLVLIKKKLSFFAQIWNSKLFRIICIDDPFTYDVTATVGPGYNDISLLDASYIAPDILWFQLIAHCWP